MKLPLLLWLALWAGGALNLFAADALVREVWIVANQTSCPPEAEGACSSTIAEAVVGVVNEPVVLHLTPNNYSSLYSELSPTYYVIIIGEGAQPSDVVIQGCTTTGGISASWSFSNVWLAGPCTWSAVLEMRENTSLTLQNVYIQNVDKAAISMGEGAILTTDNLAVGPSSNAVILKDGALWESNNNVIIHGDQLIPNAAVVVSPDAHWHSKGLVKFVGVYLSHSKWISDGEVAFEGGNRSVELLNAEWLQNGRVSFADNSGSFLVQLDSSKWYSNGPVALLDGNVIAEDGALFSLRSSELILSYTLHTGQPSNVPVFLCESSSAVWGPWKLGQRDCQMTILPTAAWQPNPTHLVVSDKNKQKKVVLFEARPERFSVRFDPLPEGQFPLKLTTNGLPIGDPSVSLEENVINVQPGQSQADYTLSIQDTSSTKSFSVMIEPTAGETPSHVLQSDNFKMDVVVTSALRLTSAAVAFPEGTPDFVFGAFAPPDDDPQNPGATASLRAFFLEFVEKDPSEQAVLTVSLAEVMWDNVVDSASGETVFSTNLNVSHGASTRMEVRFRAVEAGGAVELPDGSVLEFGVDSLKWTLVLEDWPFADENNVLELHTTLRTGEAQWLSITENKDEEGEESIQQEFELEAEHSSALLRVLSIAWAEEDFATALQVGVVVEASQQEASDVEVVFTLPHFQHSLRYDPDVSVLLASEGGEDGDGGEDADEEDDDGVLVIVLPVVLGVVVLAVVVVIVTVVLVQRRRSKKDISSSAEVVNFE
ncbi:hypothetical protein QOT17_003331 [Balamuthia mandrillaris]